MPCSAKFSMTLQTEILSTETWGWSSGAKVLGKLSVPRRPTDLDDSRAMAYCACSRCGWGRLNIFLSSFLSLFFLPLFGRRPDTVLKGR